MLFKTKSSFKNVSELMKFDLMRFGINILNLDILDNGLLLKNSIPLLFGFVSMGILFGSGLIYQLDDFDKVIMAFIAIIELFVCFLKYCSYILVREELQNCCKWLFKINDTVNVPIIDNIAQEVMENFNIKCIFRVRLWLLIICVCILHNVLIYLIINRLVRILYHGCTISCILYAGLITQVLPLPTVVPFIPNNMGKLYIITNALSQMGITFFFGYVLAVFDSLFIFLLNYIISQFVVVKKCFEYLENHFESFELNDRIIFIKTVIYIHKRTLE